MWREGRIFVLMPNYKVLQAQWSHPCTHIRTTPLATSLNYTNDSLITNSTEFLRIIQKSIENKKYLNSTKFDVTIASQCSAFYTIPITLVGPSALFHKLKYYVHSRKNSFDNPLLTVYFQIPGQTLWRDIFKCPLTNGAQKHICRNIFIVDCLLSNSWSDFMAGYIQKSSDQWRTKTHL